MRKKSKDDLCGSTQEIKQSSQCEYGTLHNQSFRTASFMVFAKSMILNTVQYIRKYVLKLFMIHHVVRKNIMLFQGEKNVKRGKKVPKLNGKEPFIF